MRIKKIRLRQTISQKDLAYSLGIAPNTLSQYENEKREPDLKTLENIAKFFNISVDRLLGRNLYFQDIFSDLCIDRDVTPRKVCIDTGIDPDVAEKWITGEKKPDAAEFERLAEYFKVPTSYLLGIDPMIAQSEIQDEGKAVPPKGNGLSESTQCFVDLVEKLTPDQQQLLLAQLQAWTAQNQQQASAALPSDGKTAPGSAP